MHGVSDPLRLPQLRADARYAVNNSKLTFLARALGVQSAVLERMLRVDSVPKGSYPHPVSSRQ